MSHAYPYDAEFTFDEGDGEVWLAELADDLDAFADPLPSRLTGEVKIGGGATVRLRLRIGGTIGLPDGVQHASVDKTGAAFSAFSATGAVANPGADQPIKLTGEVVVGAGQAHVRGSVAVLGVPSGPGGDAVPPVVVFTPPDTSEINAGSTINIKITDNVMVGPHVIWAKYDSGLEEMIWREGAFAEVYKDDSTSSLIVDGISFDIKRRGGFPGPPRITVLAVDTSGNPAT